MADNHLDDAFTWHRIYSSEAEAKQQLPQRQMRLLQLGGEDICLAHTFAGFFALADSCPHLGHSLSRGTTNYLNEVICPWHSYRYNLANGRECDYRTRPAKLYPVAVCDDGVYVGTPKPEPNA